MNTVERIETLVARLHQHASQHDDAEIAWAGASTEQALASGEQALGVRIAGSFREFILLAGGGGLDLFRIGAVPADDPLGGLGTVHGDTLHWRHRAGGTPLPAHFVVIQCDQDDNGPFCLDTSRVVAGENPVVLFYPNSRVGHVDRIAPTFLDFYEEYLAAHFDGRRSAMTTVRCPDAHGALVPRSDTPAWRSAAGTERATPASVRMQGTDEGGA